MAATQLIIRALYSVRDMVTPALAEGINLLLYIPVSIGLAHLLGAPGLAAALTERLTPAREGCRPAPPSGGAIGRLGPGRAAGARNGKTHRPHPASAVGHWLRQVRLRSCCLSIGAQSPWGKRPLSRRRGDREKGDALPYQQNNGRRAR
jgi:hypothetical protein